MDLQLPRGIAVVDAGKTNTKVILFGADGKPVAERKVPSQNREGPPYRAIDPAPVRELCQKALPELDAILPIDVIVPCAHGAALACLAGDGTLALPIMDYTSEPPPEIIASYRRIEPPFSEVFGPLRPMALTHGLQLYWQQQSFAHDFEHIKTIVPWIQYVGFCLSGKLVTEISGMACQSHLMNIRDGGYSSLVKRMGWQPLFPLMARAWEANRNTARGIFGSEFSREREGPGGGP